MALDVPQEKAPRPRRDRDRTRGLLLEVASKLLAKDGPEGFSVSQVAQLAGVNRGTAYHHFQTREQLVKEAKAWISQNLCQEIFGEPLPAEGRDYNVRRDPREVTDKLAKFAIEHPEFGRAWLFDVLCSTEPMQDPFWSLYRQHVDHFVRSEYAAPGIDAEVHAMMMVVSLFFWPVWSRAHEAGPRQRRELAKRYSNESLRLGLDGVFRNEKFPALQAGRRNWTAAADEAGEATGDEEPVDAAASRS